MKLVNGTDFIGIPLVFRLLGLHRLALLRIMVRRTRILFWFKVDYCFLIVSPVGLVYYLIINWWLRSSSLFNRVNMIHMTTSLSWQLNSLCIMFYYQRYPPNNMCGFVFYSYVEFTSMTLSFHWLHIDKTPFQHQKLKTTVYLFPIRRAKQELSQTEQKRKE
jgi:hypothetical protein